MNKALKYRGRDITATAKVLGRCQQKAKREWRDETSNLPCIPRLYLDHIRRLVLSVFPSWAWRLQGSEFRSTPNAWRSTDNRSSNLADPCCGLGPHQHSSALEGRTGSPNTRIVALTVPIGERFLARERPSHIGLASG